MTPLLFPLITIVVAVIAAIVMAFLNHGLGVYSAWTALLLGLLAGSFVILWGQCLNLDHKRTVEKKRLFGPNSNPDPNGGFHFWEWLMIVVFVGASARSFLWLVYHDGNFIKVLSPNNLGDLSLHMSLIRYLAVVPQWWPTSPILLHEPLCYSLGTDLFNSLLLLIGVPVEKGLIWVGVLGAALTGVALWRWGRAFVMAAFLFNGGLAGVLFFKDIDPESAVAWKNLFLSLFVTQRGFLYALPTGLLLLTTWRDNLSSPSAEAAMSCVAPVQAASQQSKLKDEDEVKNKSEKSNASTSTGNLNCREATAPSTSCSSSASATLKTGSRAFMTLPVQALLLGAMPLFSVHTFLFLSAVIVGLMISSSCARNFFFKLALIAWPCGLWTMWLVSGGGASKSSIGWHPGWMQEGNAAWFWLWNFGIALPLTLFLIVVLFFRLTRTAYVSRAFVWPAAMMFLLCMLIRFAPWPWDNTKLMMWSWLTIAPFLWSEVIVSCSSLMRALLCVLLFASGGLSLVSGLDGSHGYEIAQRSELDTTAALLQYLPPTAVIATASEYNHPVLLLGHPVVAGYEGHLWSHGLSYQQQLIDLKAIMMGEEGWEAHARRLGIRAIYWSRWERAAFPQSKLPFAYQQKQPFLYEVPLNREIRN